MAQTTAVRLITNITTSNVPAGNIATKAQKHPADRATTEL